MSAAERASEASSEEQANEYAARANKQTDERVLEYLRRDSWTVVRCHLRLSGDCCLFQSPLSIWRRRRRRRPCCRRRRCGFRSYQLSPIDV